MAALLSVLAAIAAPQPAAGQVGQPDGSSAESGQQRPLGQVLNSEGYNLLAAGKYQEAAETYSRMLEFCETAPPPNKPHCLIAGHIGRGTAWQRSGEWTDAVLELSAAIATARAMPPPGSPRLGEAAMQLAGIMQRRGDWTSVEALMLEALGFSDTGRAEPPLDRLAILWGLSEALEKQNKTAALAGLSGTVRDAWGRMTAHQRATAWPLAWRVGKAAIAAGRLGDAETMVAEALDSITNARGRNTVEAMAIRGELGTIYWRQQRWDDAAARFGEVLDFHTAKDGDLNLQAAETLAWLARNALDANRRSEAKAFALRASRSLEAIGARDTPTARALAQMLADLDGTSAPQVAGTDANAERQKMEQQARDLVARINEEQRTGKYEQALGSLKERIRLLTALQGSRANDVFHERIVVVFTLINLGRSDEASREIDDVLRDLQGVGNASLEIQAINALAVARYEQGRLIEAEAECRRALALLAQPVYSPYSQRFKGSLLANLGGALRRQGKYTEAIAYGEQAVAFEIERVGAHHMESAGAMHLLGNTYGLAGRSADAARLRRQALEIRERLAGDQNRFTIVSLATVGNDLIALGDLAQAEALIDRAMAAALKVYGADNIRTAEVRETVAALRVAQGRYADAVPELQQALEAGRRAFGANHGSVVGLEYQVATLLAATGQLAEAEALQRKVLEGARRAQGERHPAVTPYQAALAFTLIARGQLVEATRLLRDNLAILTTTQGTESPTLSPSILGLGRIAWHQGEIDEAAVLSGRAIQLLDKAGMADWPETALARVQLAEALLAQRKTAEAAAAMSRVRQIMERARLDETPLMIQVLRTSGFVALQSDRPAEAVAEIDRAIGLLQSFKANRGTGYAMLLNDRGLAAAALFHHAEASQYFQRAVKVMASAGQPNHLLCAIALSNEAKSLDGLGRKDDAQKRRAQAQVILRFYQFVPKPRDRWI